MLSETRKTPENESSHIIDGEYAILMETNGKECESWYYFIRIKDNMEALQHLNKQLEAVEWYILDDLSTFDLELDRVVSARTAKEMSKVDLNHYSFHRKFDGKLDTIHLGFKDSDDDDGKMCKSFDHLGYGQIEDYINDEDIDEEDLTTDVDTDTDTDDESDTDTSEDSDNIPENPVEVKEKRKGVPPALLNTNCPKWARHKKRGK